MGEEETSSGWNNNTIIIIISKEISASCKLPLKSPPGVYLPLLLVPNNFHVASQSASEPALAPWQHRQHGVGWPISLWLYPARSRSNSSSSGLFVALRFLSSPPPESVAPRNLSRFVYCSLEWLKRIARYFLPRVRVVIVVVVVQLK